ncbi:MAG: hypothetical protein JO273_02405 [Methylobacteriaceae bacterium]|nr:hypothetical protein [Methylobacteriaceae bacterium]
MADDTSSSGFGPVSYKPKLAASAQRSEVEATLRSMPGVQGVGEGRDADGAPTWIAYCKDSDAASRLPATLAQRTVVPIVSGVIKAR